MNPFLRVAAASTLLALWGLEIGCRHDPQEGGGAEAEIHSLEISPSGSFTLFAGESIHLTAKASDRKNRAVSFTESVTWISSHPDIAEASEEGWVGALAPGVTEITAITSGITSNPVLIQVDCNGFFSAFSGLDVEDNPLPSQDFTSVSVHLKDCDPSSPPDVMDGTTIYFNLSPAELGSLPSEAMSQSGMATVTLTSGPDGGTGTLTASIEGQSLTTDINIFKSILIQPLGPLQFAVGGLPQQFTAQALDSNGNRIPGVSFLWASSNSTIATVSSTGLATPVSPGAVTITASASGVTSNSVDFTVDCNGVPSSIWAMSASPAMISTLAISSISATLQDCDPATLPNVPDGTTVTFSLSPSTIGTMTAQASTVNGVATGTFTSGTEAGVATITATRGTISKSMTVTISAPAIGSIEFGSASPQVIGVKTGGQPKNSTITFLVKDVNGQPAEDGTPVIFTLIGPQGTSTSAPTNPDQESLTFYSVSTSLGNATTTMFSGTVAGTVEIIACVDANGNSICDTGEISSTSVPLSIGGGIPSMRNFSIESDRLNLAGLAYSNEAANLSVSLADRFGNSHVVEGSVVSFYTEAGAISQQGIADNHGKADAVLLTGGPTPIDVDPRDSLNPIIAELYYNLNDNGHDIGEPFEDYNHNGSYDIGENFTDLDGDGYDLLEPNPRDGWVTILAVAQGEETFDDLNGDGLYNAGEAFDDNGGEPFIDANDNGMYDDNETFVDLDFNGSYTPGEVFYDKGRGEPYLDVNGNNVRDATEPFTDLDRDLVYDRPGEPFFDANSNGIYDVGEPFIDDNGDGAVDATDGNSVFDSGGFYNHVYDRGEFYLETNGDGVWTHGNGVWDSSTTLWVTKTVVFTSVPHLSLFTSRIFILPGSQDPVAPLNFFVPQGGCAEFKISVSDVNRNTLPSGSRIEIQNNIGNLIGPSDTILPDLLSVGPWVQLVQLCDVDPLDGAPPEAAALDVLIHWIDQTGAVLTYPFSVLGTID